MPRPQSLILISTSYPSADEGAAAAGSFVQDFAEELARHVLVRVVAPALHDSLDQYGTLSVHRFRVPQLPLSTLVSTNPLRLWRAFQAWSLGRRAVLKACETNRPDHVLALWSLPSGSWAESARQRYGIPFSTWSLGSDIWSLGRIPGVRRRLIHVLKKSSHCFADGAQLGADVQELSGRSCEFLASSRRLPTIAREPRSAIGRGLRLAFLGRWHANKGVDLLLEALNLLRDRDWDRIERVRINGGGPLENLVRSGVERLVDAHRPVVCGSYLDRDEAARLMAWADYLLIPSRIESIPVIFSDAMQARCRVLATPVGDLPELLHRYPVGILAEQPSSAALAVALQRILLNDPQNDQQLEAAQCAAAKEFSVEGNVERLLSRLGLCSEASTPC